MTGPKRNGVEPPKRKARAQVGAFSPRFARRQCLHLRTVLLQGWLYIWPRACRVCGHCRRGRSAALVGTLTAVTAATCCGLYCGRPSFTRLWLLESRLHRCIQTVSVAVFTVGRGLAPAALRQSRRGRATCLPVTIRKPRRGGLPQAAFPSVTKPARNLATWYTLTSEHRDLPGRLRGRHVWRPYMHTANLPNLS